MALYSIYPQSSSQMIYQDSQRSRQQALQSQLGYYPEQHPVHPSQGLALSDAASTYSRPYATAYDHMSMGYSIPQPAYTSSLAMSEDLHHGYPYPRLMQSGLLPGMSDEADTASRPRLTAEQTRELEALYAANNKPSTQQKQEYAQRFRLTKNRVDNWFQNRRAKSKHQTKAKQTEIALTNTTNDGSIQIPKEDSERQQYPNYQYRDNLPSQDAPLDLLASVPFGKDQSQDLNGEDDYTSSEQNSWRTTHERPTRQSSTAHTEYSHGSDYTNKQVLGSEPCQSPSPASLKSFDYPVTTTYQSQPHLADYPPEAFVRRGSMLSDLTSHMNGIHMPTDSSTNEMFSIEPRRGFGERRPQRPAALSTMRSTSSGSTLRSPLMTINSLPKSLRRINTCGSPLNKAGRIQKHGTITPSKSPGALSQALERAMDQLTPQIVDEAASPDHVAGIEDVEDNKNLADGALVFNVNPPSADASWNENVHVDYSVPPLSASLTGDDGSPPITPLPGHESFGNPWTNQDMSTIASTSLPTYHHAHSHGSPLILQQDALMGGSCLNSQRHHQQTSTQHQPSINHQYWDGTSGVSDPFSVSGSPSIYDFGGSGNTSAHVSRPGSLSSATHGTGMSSRRYPYGHGLNDYESSLPLKIEFSQPLQEALPHYYVPLRENQNYVFQEYNPELARRGE